MRPMLKHYADALIFALAEASSDKNLNSNGEAHRQSGEHIIVQAGHHGGAQLVGAEVTQESRIGKGDDGLCKIAQHDGIGDAPNLSV